MKRERSHPDEKSGERRLDEQERLELLRAEVRHYIDHVYVDMADSHHRRAPKRVDFRQSHSFFVSRERFERLREILEYMLHFTHHLPMAPEEEAAAQFRQFRDHLLAHAALLQETDVAAAAGRARSGSGEGLPDAAKAAERAARDITAAIRSARAPLPDDWRKLFHAVQRICAFWFELKASQVSHVRESDVYLYRLAEFLLRQLDCVPSRPAEGPAAPAGGRTGGPAGGVAQ